MADVVCAGPRVRVCVDVAVEVASQRASIADLKAMIPVLERGLMSSEQLSLANDVTVKAAQEACRVKSSALQAECDALSSLSAEETLKQKDKFAQVDYKPLSEASTQLQQALENATIAPQPSPLIECVRRIIAPVLLPSLDAAQRFFLTRFLVDIPLVSSSRAVNCSAECIFDEAGVASTGSSMFLSLCLVVAATGRSSAAVQDVVRRAVCDGLACKVRWQIQHAHHRQSSLQAWHHKQQRLLGALDSLVLLLLSG